MAAEAKRASRPHPQQMVKCPRCDSSETKFCYYNNYSTAQPRYFCKNCKRYWTEGGTLRNVPVGGGLRKNKRFKTKLNPAPSSPQPAAAIHQPFTDNLTQFKLSNIAAHAGLPDLNPEINFESPHTTNYLFFSPMDCESADAKAAATTNHLSLYQSEPTSSPLPLPVRAAPAVGGAYFAACPWPQERGLPQSLHPGEYLPRIDNSNYTVNFVNVNDWHQVSEGVFGTGGDNNYALMHPPQLSQWTDFDANTRL